MCMRMEKDHMRTLKILEEEEEGEGGREEEEERRRNNNIKQPAQNIASVQWAECEREAL